MLNLESGFGTAFPHPAVPAHQEAQATIEPAHNHAARPEPFCPRPRDIVNNPYLTVSEKKAILSSWASDLCAVESNPALRKPPGFAVPLLYDDIMAALLSLDETEAA